MRAFYLPWPLAAEMVPVCAAAICAFLVMPLIVHARYWEKERVCAGPQNVHIEPTSRLGGTGYLSDQVREAR